MAANIAPDTLWSSLRELIARKTGLHFPTERHADLLRGLASAAEELGFADAAACAEGLLSSQLTREQLHVLAGHLTIGETYFFRDRAVFDALAERVLPELIERRAAERHLSVWSAACCTGEEAYSLAILLSELAPGWRITLIASDINERFLQKARAGVYGEWSFRGAPAGLKTRYFERTAEGRYALVPHIRQMVRFERFNLAQDPFRAPQLGGQMALDLILCRNVLMYFTPEQAAKVAGHLHDLLREDGWLALAASEGSRALLPRLSPVSFPGAIFHQKVAAQPKSFDVAGTLSPASQLRDALPIEPRPPPERPKEAPLGLQSEVLAAAPREDASALAHEARSLANQGRLGEALERCDRSIALDALDSRSRYLRAVILEELGKREEARRALLQTIYLEPDFVLAHVALGRLACEQGSIEEGSKHFGNAFALLRHRGPDELLPESDGLTAGRLQEIVDSLISSAAVT